MSRNGQKKAQEPSILQQWILKKEGTSATQGVQSEADWSGVNPQLIVGSVVAAANLGGAILFGRTRDRFMFAITLYAEGDKRTEYYRPDETGIEQLELFLHTLIEWGNVLF
jgi:hypothetical protein